MSQTIIKSVLKRTTLLLAFITITLIHCFTIFNFIKYLRIEYSSLIYYIGNLVLIWYSILSTLIIYSFILLAIKDPGTLESLGCDINVPGEFKSPVRYCTKCTEKRWKPPRAHHCKSCNACIFKMDHHCVLINNCIGYSNQKIYILFLFYITCSASLMIISSFFLISRIFFSSIESGINKMKIVLIIILIINLIILLTTAIFLFDQIDYISSNATLVELISNMRGKEIELFKNFIMIFGENKYSWLLPSSNTIKPDFNEELYEIIDFPKCRLFSEIRLADSNEQLKPLLKISNIKKKKFKSE